MARGTEGKANLVKKFAEKFGTDFIGEVNGKYIFWSTENGERIQIAAALTCPKTLVDAPAGGGNLNFEDTSAPAATNRKAELDAEEKATLERLMKELDL